jgi:hypothetical protein
MEILPVVVKGILPIVVKENFILEVIPIIVVIIKVMRIHWKISILISLREDIRLMIVQELLLIIRFISC